MKKTVLALILLTFVACSCSKRQSLREPDEKGTNTPPQTAAKTLFRTVPPRESGIHFTNAIQENEQVNLIDYFYLYNGGGVGIGDVNNDGLSDLYFTGNQTSSRLYLNRGNLRFEDVTAKAGVGTAGWCTGITLADVNADGWLDLYVCRAGNAEPARRTNLLFINNGGSPKEAPTFTERAAEYGLAFTGYSTQSAFFDYDKDGDLDCYLLTHANNARTPNTVVPPKRDGSGAANDRLYRNEGPAGKPAFTDVTQRAGIVYDGMGLGLGINDLNGDGWEDIYVSNDFLANDQLYLNNRNGTFTNQAAAYLKHQSNFAMGNDLADFNNDGWVDIMVTDMLPGDNEQRKKMAGPMKYGFYQTTLKAGYQPQFMRNTLQLNNGPQPAGGVTFSEVGQLAGVHATDWSWAPLFADFDNDGWKDLLITNGYRRDITDLDFVVYNASLSGRMDEAQADAMIKEKAKAMPGLKKSNYAFRNKGDLTFEDASAAWGMATPSYSNGAAFGDLDNDGDLDVVVSNLDEPAFMQENRAAQLKGHHYLKIELKGSPANPFGLGATVRLYGPGGVQVYHQAVTRGYQSSVDYPLHAGLGGAAQIDSLHITWPDGKEQQMHNVPANQTLVLDHARAARRNHRRVPTAKPLFADVTGPRKVNFLHREDEFNDFALEPLLPNGHSRSGPGLAVGDLNGDGREDFYVGGAYNQTGEIFYQTAGGTFRAKPLTAGAKYEEETGSLLFDADHDGDLDLYVACGSNEFGPGSAYYQDKLYLNDGKGNFRWARAALPVMRTSTSCVTAADYDRDGDLDLFVGGRLSPLQYPKPGTSYLLQNNGGSFTDVTDRAAPQLRHAGMVTTALWTDCDGDGQTDLMVAGEFMGIRLYRGRGGQLEDVTPTTGLALTSGWWNSLNGADFDNDGDTDYVAGNWGRNIPYRVSPDQPVSVYAGDFNGDGRLDPVLTHYLNGQEYPFHSRDELINQMTGLRKKFTRYAEYAKAKVTDITAPETLAGAYTVRAVQFESTYLENLGGGKFRTKPLPVRAQTAPVFGTLCADADGDGNTDLLLVGNSYASEVVTGPYDAFTGLLLRGDGRGNFEPLPSQKSGFFVDGDAKAMASLTLDNGQRLVLVTQNAGRVKVFGPAAARSSSGLRPFSPQPTDAWAVITLADGTRRKQEFYYGASYLSQSSRRFVLPPDAASVVVYDYAGRSRKIK